MISYTTHLTQRLVELAFQYVAVRVRERLFGPGIDTHLADDGRAVSRQVGGWGHGGFRRAGAAAEGHDRHGQGQSGESLQHLHSSFVFG